MSRDRFWTEVPLKPHIAQHALGGELMDLRSDVGTALAKVADEIDGGVSPGAHALGGALHTADTIAHLEAKLSDLASRHLVLDDNAAMTNHRDPNAHALGGSAHSSDTIANLEAKLSDLSGRHLVLDDNARFKRETVRFVVPGALAVLSELDGVWEAPAAGAIKRVTAYCKTTGSDSGATIVDVNINSTTIFTNQSNRPSVAYNAVPPTSIRTGAAIEAGTFAAGDLITVDVDAIDGGPTAADLTVIITVEYSG